MADFADWVERVSDGATPVFVGFNAAFDWSFVNHYLLEHVGRNPFGFAPLDLKALAMGRLGCRWDETRMSRLPAWLRPSRPLTHTALDDARQQAEIAAKLFARLRG
jgi:hypothetical protein